MDFKKRVSVLHKIALVVLAAAWSDGYAVGLGSIQVQSALNQPLRVTLPIFGTDISSISELCLKGKIESFDGMLVARPQINFAAGAQPSTLIMTTTQPINEPALIINVEVGCGTSVRRSYQALLDPVTLSQTVTKLQSVTPALADVSMVPAQPAVPAASAAPVVAAPAMAAPAKKEKTIKSRQEQRSQEQRRTGTRIEIEQEEKPDSINRTKHGRATESHRKEKRPDDATAWQENVA